MHDIYYWNFISIHLSAVKSQLSEHIIQNYNGGSAPLYSSVYLENVHMIHDLL